MTGQAKSTIERKNTKITKKLIINFSTAMIIIKRQFSRIPFISTLILFLSGGILSVQSFGQVPPPPPPPNSGTNNGHNLGGNQGTPGAPIGGGFGILIALAAFYTGKKVIAFKNEKKEESIS